MGSRFSSLALSTAPYVALGALALYVQSSKNMDWNDALETTTLQRTALWVHLSYFITVPILIEVFPDLPGMDILVGPTMPRPSNMRHMLQCLAAENFFVTSTALACLLANASAPRWTWMPVWAQLMWNLKNHVSWWFLGKVFCPEGPFLFAVADMCIIWPIVGIYGYNFFSTTAGSDKQD